MRGGSSPRLLVILALPAGLLLAAVLHYTHLSYLGGASFILGLAYQLAASGIPTSSLPFPDEVDEPRPEPETAFWGPDYSPQWRLKFYAGSTHPVPEEGFYRSFTPPNATLRESWTRVVAALDAGAPVKMVVIGGSSER